MRKNEFTINTGDSLPKRQAARRIPHGARHQTADHLRKMQHEGAIQPLLTSPVVLVRKRDGNLRFCVDYHSLNTVIKADLFPLPRINDLMDKLGKANFFHYTRPSSQILANTVSA